MCWLAIGCASVDPPQASGNEPSTQDLFVSTHSLTVDEQQRALAVMRETIPGPETPAPAPARFGVRWSDVDNGVRWGGSVAEMAVLRKSLDDTKSVWTYELITAADVPVTLTVRREPPPRIYSASAVAGLFGDRREVADHLLREFHAAMKLYGAKPMPPEFDDE